MPPPEERPAPGDGATFLLAQIGAHAAMRFAERLGEHNLTPPLVGVLRLLRISPGQSQQSLAERLGLLPGRLVPLLDDLEGRGLVRREPGRTDRRVNVLEITPDGVTALQTVASVMNEHEGSLLAGISAGERATLAGLLQRIAGEQGLSQGIHPGYRTLDPGSAPTSRTARRKTTDNSPAPTASISK